MPINRAARPARGSNSTLESLCQGSQSPQPHLEDGTTYRSLRPTVCLAACTRARDYLLVTGLAPGSDFLVYLAGAPEERAPAAAHT